MNSTIYNYPPLATILWPTEGNKTVLRNIVLVVAGSLLLTISAKIQIPFLPVPMTMQTFVILVIGMSFGTRLGASTVALYLVEGVAGLPVFAGTPAKGIGLAYMMGSTGGYLAGFFVATVLVGFLASKGWDRTVTLTLAAMLLGMAVIFLFGVAWLGSLIGFSSAVKFGVLPFLPAEVFKIVLATALLPAVWKWVGKQNL